MLSTLARNTKSWIHRSHERTSRPAAATPGTNDYSQIPICTLPAEIISEIFDLVQSETRSRGDHSSLRIAIWLASVCRYWRDIARSTPLLWLAVIDLADGDLFQRTRRRLSLSEDLGLTVKLHVKLNCLSKLEYKIVGHNALKFLQPHLDRIERFHLSTASEHVLLSAARLLFEPARPLRLLKDLKINVFKLDFKREGIVSALSQLQIGLNAQVGLKSVHFTGLYPPWSANFTRLVDLHLDLAHSIYLPSRLSIEEILGDQPNLQSLVLHGVDNIPGSPSDDSSSFFQFNSLQFLSIGFMRPTYISYFLSRFSTPVLKEFHIAGPTSSEPCDKLVVDIREFLSRQRSSHPDKTSTITTIGFISDYFGEEAVASILSSVPNIDTLYAFSRRPNSILDVLGTWEAAGSPHPRCAHLRHLEFEHCSTLDLLWLRDLVQVRRALKMGGYAESIDRIVVRYCGMRQPGWVKNLVKNVVWKEQVEDQDEEAWLPSRSGRRLT